MQHTNHRRPSRLGRGVAVALVAVGLVAASCGSDDDGDSGGDGGGAADTTTASTSGPATTAGGSGTTGAGGATTGPASSAAATTLAADTEGEPQPGGRLVVGIEADTASPWTPSNMVCAISCYQVARSVYDQLTLPNAAGEVEPYLAQSIEPNADYTEWTITVRPGVSFHDGTPLDGAAVVDNLERARKSFLTGRALADVSNVSVSPTDPNAAVVTMARPWVDFPIYLAGQIGMIASPTWLAAVDADPTRATQPVGTGPFTFVSYKPGESFTARKNPNYWNQPYPYLDEVEYRPIIDALTRQSALEAGDIDLIHTTNGESIAALREQADEFPMLETDTFGETTYWLMNVGDPESPLSDRRIRCALANAQDSRALIERLQDNVNEVANSPFSAGQAGNSPDSGFPIEQDMQEAQRLVAEYKAENPGPVSISISTTPDESSQVFAQAQAEWFREAGIDEVELANVEQGQFIGLALTGDFQTFLWRNHGGRFLDQQYIWWHSSNALPLGQLGLNFGRINDPVIDEALDANRGEADPAVKAQYAATIAERFASECYNLWLYHTLWGIPHRPEVKGIDAFALPSGAPAQLGAGISGTFNINGVWLDQ